MPISLPASQDVRVARTRMRETLGTGVDVVRAPLLAWIGAGDLAVSALSRLPSRLSPAEARQRVDEVGDRVRKTYAELVDRGEQTVERIRRQPKVAGMLRDLREATDRINQRVEQSVDDAHDAGGNVLARASTRTRSVGERAARATERAADDLAESVERAGDEAEELVKETGAKSAHTTRSATRKAANRTAPAERRGR